MMNGRSSGRTATAPRASRAALPSAGVLAMASIGLSLALGACREPGDASEPTIEPPDATIPAEPAEPTAEAPSDSAPQCETLGASPLRRLTARQYEHSVRDVLGVELDLTRSLPSDARLGIFASNAGSSVTTFHVDKYMATAERVAEAAMVELDARFDCSPAIQGDQACAERFIDQIGARLYRRPLDDDEQAALAEVYAVGREGRGFDEGIRLVLETMLQMPQFLYLPERGLEVALADRRALTPYELASRLSYSLWNTTPDDALLDAAASGELATPEGLLAQTERLLDSHRAKDAIASFHVQWLGIQGLKNTAKDPALYPRFSDDMLAGMERETIDFADYVVRESGGTYATLMTAPYSFVDPAVAPVYGLSPDVDPTVPTALDPDERGGVLFHASVLTQHARYNKTSPVLRGVFLRRNVLCQAFGSPPPGVDTTLEEPEFGEDPLSTAEVLERHRRNQQCAVCHDLIDPVGVVFEHYGALGEYRQTENGLEIPEPDDLEGTDVDGPLEDAKDFAHRLAASPLAHECYATQMFRFTVGRNERTDDDCALEHLTARFAETDGNIRDLIVSIVMSETFRHRGALVEEDA